MKILIKWTWMFVVVVCYCACKKDNPTVNPLASLNVVNGVVNGKVVRLNTYLRDSALVMGNKNFTLVAGENIPIKLFASSTPNSPYYNGTINAKDGEYFSLFLGGNANVAVDALLIKDTYKNYLDSTFAVRFVNMSQGSQPLSVNLVTEANGSTVTSLPYKSISEFKKYSGDYKHLTYAFEIRDAGTGALLMTYTFKPSAPSANPIPRFQNVTLVYKGVAGGTGTNALGILRVNNYQ